jgi:hypothetical protein
MTTPTAAALRGMDDDEVLTGSELEAARWKIRVEAEAACARMVGREHGGTGRGAWATLGDLADVMDILVGKTVDFVTTHTARRCVMKEDADTITRALAPMWRGTWKPGISYAVNALVNDKSCLWISERPTAARPGTPDDGWRLVVKGPR